MQRDFLNIKIGLTGSGEVKTDLGSLKLPRNLDCLPALDSPDSGNWGIAEIAPECVTSVGEGCRLATAEPEN